MIGIKLRRYRCAPIIDGITCYIDHRCITFRIVCRNEVYHCDVLQSNGGRTQGFLVSEDGWVSQVRRTSSFFERKYHLNNEDVSGRIGLTLSDGRTLFVPRRFRPTSPGSRSNDPFTVSVRFVRYIVAQLWNDRNNSLDRLHFSPLSRISTLSLPDTFYPSQAYPNTKSWMFLKTAGWTLSTLSSSSSRP